MEVKDDCYNFILRSCDGSKLLTTYPFALVSEVKLDLFLFFVFE